MLVISLGRFKIENGKETVDVVGPAVLILQIIGVFPDVQRDDRAKSAGKRSILVRCIDDFQPSRTVGNDPPPTRTELRQGTFLKPRAENVHGTVICKNCVIQSGVLNILMGNGAAENIKVHSVVVDASGVMPDGGLNLKRKPTVLPYQTFQRPALVGRAALQRVVQVLYISPEVLLIVEFHRLGTEVRFQRIHGIGERGQLKRVAAVHFGLPFI